MNAITATETDRFVVCRQTFDDVMAPTYAPSQLVPVKARGLELWDSGGRRYLDFTSGIGVTSLGHCAPDVVAALAEQAGALWHVGNGYTNEPVLRLAKALTAATFAERAFFCNSGAEANEAAFKLARKHAHDRHGAHKTRIVSCLNAFHGRTLFTVSVGGQSKYTEGFAPLPPDLQHIPFNDIDAARAAVTDEVCAVVVEPIQGEGGLRPADGAYLAALRELCDRTGALLIFDEVQCGMGRTGDLFAYMGYGVTPDILTVAKALGNGCPVGAMLTTDAIGRDFTVGSHGTTYGGNPLAAAVAGKVVDTIARPEFLARVRDVSGYLAGKLDALAHRFPDLIAEVRGRGLMTGLALTKAHQGRAKDIARAAERCGLMVLIAGPDVVRLLPALVVTREQIDEADVLLRQALQAYLASS